MAKSHGASPDQYEIDLFREELKRIPEQEKLDFLKSKIEEFALRVDYPDRSNPILDVDIQLVIEAGVQLTKLTGINKVQIEFFVNRLADKLRDIKVDENRVRSLEARIQVDQEVQEAIPSGSNTPEISQSLPLGYQVDGLPAIKTLGFSVDVIRGKERDVNLVSLIIFPELKQQGEYLRRIQQLASYIVNLNVPVQGKPPKIWNGREVKSVEDSIKSICEECGGGKSFREVKRDLLNSLGQVTGELTRVFRHPGLLSEEPQVKNRIRSEAIRSIERILRNSESSGVFGFIEILDKSNGLKGAVEEGKFATTSLFLAKNWLLARGKIDRAPLWAISQVAEYFGDKDLEEIVKSVHVVHGNTHGIKPNGQIAKDLDRLARRTDQNRFADEGIFGRMPGTWGEVVDQARQILGIRVEITRTQDR